jgi:hypothetical protein
MLKTEDLVKDYILHGKVSELLLLMDSVKTGGQFYSPWQEIRAMVKNPWPDVLLGKALLQHSHISSFVYCLWLLLNYNGNRKEKTI